jgi:hypothetical protein
MARDRLSAGRAVAEGTLLVRPDLAVSLTAEGRALRRQAERVPAAIVKRLGVPLTDLEAMHRSLTAVIAAATSA